MLIISYLLCYGIKGCDRKTWEICNSDRLLFNQLLDSAFIVTIKPDYVNGAPAFRRSIGTKDRSMLSTNWVPAYLTKAILRDLGGALCWARPGSHLFDGYMDSFKFALKLPSVFQFEKVYNWA